VAKEIQIFVGLSEQDEGLDFVSVENVLFQISELKSFLYIWGMSG